MERTTIISILFGLYLLRLFFLLLIIDFVFLFLRVLPYKFNILDDLLDPIGVNFREFNRGNPEEGNLSFEFHAGHMIFGGMDGF